MVTLLLAIIYLAFISLGLPDSLLGSAWPVMHGEMNMPTSAMGIITIIICCGTIISSLFSDKLERKLQTTFVVSISVVLTAIAILGFSFSTEFWMLCLFAIPYGLGAGAIDSSLNNYVALHYSSRHMSWLHAFWGIGTIISPYIMSFALTNSTWHEGYRFVSYIQFGLAAIMILSTPLWFKIGASNHSETIIQEKLSFKEKIKVKGIIFVLVGFMCYCSMESTALNWAATYMVEGKGISESLAAALASLTYIGMTLSRITAGFISPKLKDRNMIRISIVIIAFAILLLLLPIDNSYLTFIGFGIMGFGFGPIYPSIIHSTPINFGSSKSSAVIGLQMASAYLGSTFMPPLFGLLSQWISIKILPYFLLIFLILLTIMLEFLNYIVDKNRKEKMVKENV